MTERCHLSGLPIDEGSPVLVLPVKFGAVTESSLCYQSDRLVRAFAMPVTGVLSDYGNINTSGVAIDRLRQHVEKNLADNNPRCQIGEVTKPLPYGFDPSNNYAAMRRDNYNEAQRGEFCNESELLALHMKPNEATKRFPLKSVTASELLSLLRIAALSELSGGHIYRLTYIMIDKTFFDNLIAAHYQAEAEAIKNGILDLVLNAPERVKADGFDELFEWLLFRLENEAVNLIAFDSSDQPRDAMFKPLRKVAEVYHSVENDADKEKALSALKEWIDVITCYAMLQRVYRDQGKTYYPQVSRANVERQNQFTAFLYAQQEKRRQAKLKEYSPENGYDQETQGRYQWS